MTNEEFEVLKKRVNRAEEILDRIEMLKRRVEAFASETKTIAFIGLDGDGQLRLRDRELIEEIKQFLTKSAETEIAYLETEFAQL